KEPAWPVYAEHSFVTWRDPCFRSEDADAEATPELSERVTKPAASKRARAKTVVITFSFMVVSFRVMAALLLPSSLNARICSSNHHATPNNLSKSLGGVVVSN